MAEDIKAADVKKDFDLFSDEFSSQSTPDDNVKIVEESGIDNQEVVTKPAAPKGSQGAKVTREVDLGDGSGKQVFSADTADELLDVLTTAQLNATKKIRQQEFELKRQARAKPERPAATSTAAKELSADELFAIATELQTNPKKAIDKVFQAETGMTAAELGKFVRGMQEAQAINAADTQFLQNHQEDYVPSAANAQQIHKFLTDESLPHTAANLEYAFQELSESGLLDEAAPTTEKTDDAKVDSQGQRIAVQPHTRRKPMSTGLRNDNSSARQMTEEVSPSAMSESEVEQLYKLPIEEARALMLRKMAGVSSGKR